jgi:hypothetical protein
MSVLFRSKLVHLLENEIIVFKNALAYCEIGRVYEPSDCYFPAWLSNMRNFINIKIANISNCAFSQCSLLKCRYFQGLMLYNFLRQ